MKRKIILFNVITVKVYKFFKGDSVPGTKIIKTTVETVRKRSLPEGGFAMFSGEPFRPDATAWAILALEAAKGNRDLTIPACQQLARSQLPDGRIPIIASGPKSYWPTSLALTAWKKVPGFAREMKKAVNFLLSNSGNHSPKNEKENAIYAHDSSIKGWPWAEGTHSWIEPTSLAVIALKVCGYGKHERVLEAVKMILDRQLPSGGWNFGSTLIFGRELLPIPECTGHALCALAGYTEPDVVRLSLDYLNREAKGIRTPLTLSWSIFGLRAWSRRPMHAHDSIQKSLALQTKYGAYNTVLLAQLIVTYFTSGDFLGLFFD
jgi:hypothetical protein